MKYMGSKRRIAKHILPIMIDAADKSGITTWVEPFVGGANLIDKVPNRFTRIGSDINPHTIAALIGIRDHANELPDIVTELEYKKIKSSAPDPINSLIRFGASFGGRFDEGYARGTDSKGVPRNYWLEAKRNALKQSPLLKDIDISCSCYSELSPINSIVYCDPPYLGTKGYRTGKFDSEKFFDWCRKIAKNNIVFVSEYAAPSDFVTIWSGEQKSSLALRVEESVNRSTEKLFNLSRG